MAIIKENGTGLVDANVYADVADLDGYAALVGIDISAYTTEQKESALYISAQQYIDGMHCFKGEKVDSGQGMALYTDEVTFDDTGTTIIKVNCDTALLQLQGILFPSVTQETASGDIKSLATELDVLKKKTEYVEGTAQRYGTINTQYADSLLKPYICYGGGTKALRV